MEICATLKDRNKKKGGGSCIIRCMLMSMWWLLSNIFLKLLNSFWITLCIWVLVSSAIVNLQNISRLFILFSIQWNLPIFFYFHCRQDPFHTGTCSLDFRSSGLESFPVTTGFRYVQVSFKTNVKVSRWRQVSVMSRVRLRLIWKFPGDDSFPLCPGFV